MSEFSGDTPSDSAATGNVDARLRSSLGARGTTPELSPDLITNAPSREAPHLVNRQRRIQAAGGATLAIAAVTVGALVVSLPSQRAPLFLAASSSGSAEVGSAASSSLKMGADAAASDLRIAQWIDYRYKAGTALSGEAGTGSVYQLKRVGTVESRLRAVQRDDRGRPQPDREPVPDAQHVLGVDGCVVRRAAGGDDDVIDATRADGVGQGCDEGRGAGQEPGSHLGLFPDLVAEAHPRSRPTGRRPVAVVPPASTSASASSDPGRIE